MFGHAYFGRPYFGPSYWGQSSGTIATPTGGKIPRKRPLRAVNKDEQTAAIMAMIMKNIEEMQ